MATSYAIAAVGKAILALLAAACPKADFPGAVFELYQARSFQPPMDEGISLYLYRVLPASNVRNMPPRETSDGHRLRPSFPVDLHYLLIPWSRDPFRQQRLLGWAIRTIEDTPVLHASLLNQPGPENNIFREDESVDVLMETLSIQDIGSVWEVAKPNIQPAVAYVVRMVCLDSTVELVEADLAQTRVFGMGKVVP